MAKRHLLELYYRESMYSDFVHDGRKYDLNRLFELLTKYDNKEVQVPLTQLVWILDHTKIEEDRVEKANVKYPLIVIEWKGRIAVLDGAHRLQKMSNENEQYATCIFVTQDDLRQVEI